MGVQDRGGGTGYRGHTAGRLAPAAGCNTAGAGVQDTGGGTGYRGHRAGRLAPAAG